MGGSKGQTYHVCLDIRYQYLQICLNMCLHIQDKDQYLLPLKTSLHAPPISILDNLEDGQTVSAKRKLLQRNPPCFGRLGIIHNFSLSISQLKRWSGNSILINSSDTFLVPLPLVTISWVDNFLSADASDTIASFTIIIRTAEVMRCKTIIIRTLLRCKISLFGLYSQDF